MAEAYVDLYWLPLGAGGHFVRLNGRVYEAVASRLESRPAYDLYHSALEVRVLAGRFVIEQAPIRDGHGGSRGVVAEGPVGSRRAARFRLFRYEVRRWRDGAIPDVVEAVESPRRLAEDARLARRLLDLVPEVPTLVWGRDELGAGEMWNSNSIIAWLLACSGFDAASIDPPRGGRAPGWNAGLDVATRCSAGQEAADFRRDDELFPRGDRLHRELGEEGQPLGDGIANVGPVFAHAAGECEHVQAP